MRLGTRSCDGSSCTFRQLSGGYFRVIIQEEGGKKKFGSLVKSDQTKRTRSASEGQRLHRLRPKTKLVEPSPSSQSILRRADIDSSGCVDCPHCSQWHHSTCVKAGEMRCVSCSKRFIAVFPSAQNLPRARIDDDNDVMCPHCARWDFFVSPGEKSCENCGTRFIAY